MKVTTVGLDLAKQVFSVHGVDEYGKAVLRKRLSRGKLLEFFAQLPPVLVGMEACSGAHYWGRELERLGHRVGIMAPRFVVPYRKSQKNDGNDAEAICEAVSRPSMRVVPVKRAEQQASVRHLTRRAAHPVGNGAQLLNVRPSAAVRCRSRLFPLLAANALEGFPHIGLDAGYVTECRVKDGLQRAPPDSVQATTARARRSRRRAR